MRRTPWVLVVLAGLLTLAAAASAAVFAFGAGGLSAYNAGNFTKTESRFAAADAVAPFEDFKGPFARGTARLARQDYEGAREMLEKALKDTPEEHQCTVRGNLSLAIERQGDQRYLAADGSGAVALYEEARKVLVDGDCPVPEDIERIEIKIEMAQEPDPSPSPSPSPDPSPSPSPSDNPSPSPSPTQDPSPSPSPSIDPEVQRALEELGERNRQTTKDHFGREGDWGLNAYGGKIW